MKRNNRYMLEPKLKKTSLEPKLKKPVRDEKDTTIESDSTQKMMS